MKHLFISMLSLVLFFTSIDVVEAQFGFPCEFNRPVGYSYATTHRHVRVNYHETDRTLTLIDWNTREIYMPLLTNVDGYRFNGWSPSCRHVAGSVYIGDEWHFIVWEAETGQEVIHIQRELYNRKLQWSPDERYVMARVTNPRISHMIAQVGTSQYFITTWLDDVIWDMANNRIYTTYVREPDAVHAYALPSGELLATYAPQNLDERIFAQTMRLSYDRTHIIYYTIESSEVRVGNGNLERYFEPCSWGFGVYNIVSAQGQVVKTNCQDFEPSSRPRMILSPDKRYVAYGRDIVRVWDLHNTQADGSANWSFPASDYRIYQMRFVDNQTIETFAQYEYNIAERWNVFTGDYINSFDYENNIEINRDS